MRERIEGVYTERKRHKDTQNRATEKEREYFKEKVRGRAEKGRGRGVRGPKKAKEKAIETKCIDRKAARTGEGVGQRRALAAREERQRRRRDLRAIDMLMLTSVSIGDFRKLRRLQ